jgi:transcriptional regulator with XRE-family HTH domain
MVVEIFGKVLRELREGNKISQEKLAEYCDLDRTYISLLERGLRQPTITTIFKIAKALKTTPTKIIEKIELQSSKKIEP